MKKIFLAAICIIANGALVSCTNDEVAPVSNSSVKTNVVATDGETSGQIPTTPPK